MEANKTIKYEISGDGMGLKAYFGRGGGEYYHIHSDELTELEKRILAMLNLTGNNVCLNNL